MPKKSRSDVIRAAVGYYLKNKNYVGERYRKSDFKLVQNQREYMLQTMQNCDLERSNNFTYSNHTITNNQQIVEQFGRFTQFIESQTEVIRQELRRFYAPMLCHLYVEFLKARESRTAIEFLKKYAHLVAPVETYDITPSTSKINGCSVSNDIIDSPSSTHIRFIQNNIENVDVDPELQYFIDLLQTLSTCTQLEAAESDSEIAQFRASKYEIHTTAIVIEALMNYLEKRGHVLILNLLHSWIQIHIIDNEQNKWTDESIYLGTTIDDDLEDEESLPKENCKIKIESNVKQSGKSSNSNTPQTHVEIKTELGEPNNVDGDDTKKFQASSISMHLDTINTTREQFVKAQTTFPRCIKISEMDRGLTSAHLDRNECHMAAGFNSSVIQLWQLNQQRCSGKSLFSSKQNNSCRWEINNCNKEEENLIEFDIQKHLRNKNDRETRKYFERKYEDNSYEYGGVRLVGHGLGVTEVRFSAIYPLLYSVSKDTTMRSWHAESFNCAAIYRGHRYPIWCFDESPLGTYVVTGSKDLTARLWSTEREYPLITFIGHSQDVECIAFHPNGNYIATGSTDLSVRLWCTTSGKVMRVFPDCKQAVTSVAFSPDGKLLAAAGEEPKVRIFDIAGGSQLGELKDHTASVVSIAWNTNGRQLATACRDGTIRLWDAKRLTAIHESNCNSNSISNNSTTSTSSSSSSSSSPNRLMALNSSCQRLVKVFFGRNETMCAIGC